jgi:hypothetical protein
MLKSEKGGGSGRSYSCPLHAQNMVNGGSMLQKCTHWDKWAGIEVGSLDQNPKTHRVL